MVRHFYDINSVNNPESLIKRALEIKHSQVRSNEGKNKTIALIFLNPSLRTRISTQEAAYRMGMHVICLNSTDAWAWELKEGAVMDGDKSEHIKDAVRVLSRYVDMIGIRCFSTLKDYSEDKADLFIKTFMKYATVPVINLESSVLHPLQSLADMVTLEEMHPGKKLNVTLTWAPHPKALPHAVANSFAQWTLSAGHHLTITHPVGFELDDQFTLGASIEYNQKTALQNADIIYVKNWCSSSDYGQPAKGLDSWILDETKCRHAPNASIMHCLPVRRNVVMTDGVLDGQQSVIYNQANNRLYAAQAVIENLLNA